MIHRTAIVATFLFLGAIAAATTAFVVPSPLFTPSSRITSKSTSVPAPSTIHHVVQSNTKTKGYDPKWKKQKTIAEEMGSAGDVGFDGVGLKGTIPVTFKQGNATKTSMAWAGQPLRDVATQAGQFIKYGCGKGECGTCECMVNGKWVRPCISTVPATDAGEAILVQVKATKAKTVSSGKFYSIRSIILGFWNNVLGMIGFVKTRRAARQNWEERHQYEEFVRIKTAEKRAARLQREAAAALALEGGSA